MPTRAFLPTFLIYAIDIEGNIQYMPEFVDYQWTIDSQVVRKVSTINCKDLVDSWTELPPDLIDSIKDEFLMTEHPKASLQCPDL